MEAGGEEGKGEIWRCVLARGAALTPEAGTAAADDLFQSERETASSSDVRKRVSDARRGR